jgi:hypothetical protein
MSKGRKKKLELGEITVKIGKHTFPRLDKFFPKIIKDFSQKPDEEFGKTQISTFNDKQVYLWNINNKACMSIEDVCFYIEAKYKTVHQAFSRHKSKLIENKDYFYIKDFEKICILQNVEYKSKTRKLLFFTLHGLLILLKFIHVGLADEFYLMWVDLVCELIETKQLTSGELFLVDKRQKIIPQILGDPKKNWVDNAGNRLLSRGEMIISNILFELKVQFQIYSPIWPLKEIMKKYNYYSKNPLQPDFLVKTIPKTIIEYWGRENDSNYDSHRIWKTKIYNELKIKLIEIEPHEVQNIPILKQKLIKELKIEV